MKLNSLILFHIKNIRNMDTYEAQRYLISKGFNMIGSGCESTVFSRKGFDYVIKLQTSAFYNSGMNEDIPDTVHVIPTKVIPCSFGNIVIQQKVESTVFNNYRSINSKRFNEFVKRMRVKYSFSDLHEDNVGLIKGRFVVFDWTYYGF